MFSFVDVAVATSKVLRVGRRWPITLWWLSYYPVVLMIYGAQVYLNVYVSHDARGIGSGLFLLLLLASAPRGLVWVVMMAVSGLTGVAIDGYSWLAQIGVGAPLYVGLDLAGQRLWVWSRSHYLKKMMARIAAVIVVLFIAAFGLIT